jgi:predicted type IV restriction endonuclease
MTVQDLLKKINFIEADLEIQKQILFSLPSDQKEEMEQVIRTISEKKEEIEALRLRIKELDPEEFERILHYERAVEQLKILARDKGFKSVVGRTTEQACILKLKNSPGIDCLLKAVDGDGNWTIVTMDGRIMEFPADEVEEPPPDTIN